MFRKSFYQSSIYHQQKSTIHLILLLSFVVNILNIAVAFYSMHIFDKVLTSSSLETLFYITLITISLIIFIIFFSNYRHNLMQKIYKFYEKKFIKIIHDTHSHDQKINLITHLNKIKISFNQNYLINFFDIMISPLYLLVLYLIHPLICLFALMFILMMIFWEYFYHLQLTKIQNYLQNFQDKNNKFASFFNHKSDIFEYKKISACALQDWHKFISNARFSEHFQQSRLYNLIIYNKNFRVLIQIFATATSSFLVIANQISVGSMVAFSIILSRFFEPFSNLIGNLKGLKDLYFSLKFGINSIPQSSASSLLYDNSPNNILDNFSDNSLGKIQSLDFENIYFRHPSNKKIIIQIDKISINSPSTIAVVAKNKFEVELFSKLVSKSIILTNGTIKLNGHDLQKITTENLLKIVSILDFDAPLYFENVIQNIANDAQNIDLIRAKNIAKTIGILLEIELFEDGFETKISSLNNFQKHLVVVLRALYSHPQIIFINYHNDVFNNQLFMNYLTELSTMFKFITNPNFEMLKKCHGVIFFQNGIAQFKTLNNFKNLKNLKNLQNHEDAPLLN